MSFVNKAFIRYAIKFISIFILLYGGTYAFIGITAPGGKIYNEWLSLHLNYVNWLRAIILHGASFFTNLYGFVTVVPDDYTVSIPQLASVRIVYSCLGYGVLSFWIAFIMANEVTNKMKLKWGIGGMILILVSNMVRISFLLIGTAKKWPTLFKVDHHTVYSICNYLLIIALIFFFNKRVNKNFRKANY